MALELPRPIPMRGWCKKSPDHPPNAIIIIADACYLCWIPQGKKNHQGPLHKGKSLNWILFSYSGEKDMLPNWTKTGLDSIQLGAYIFCVFSPLLKYILLCCGKPAAIRLKNEPFMLMICKERLPFLDGPVDKEFRKGEAGETRTRFTIMLPQIP